MQKLVILVLVCFVSLYSVTITVTNTNDSGAGSFREALIDVTFAETIDFDIPTGTPVINFTSDITFDKSFVIDPSNGGRNISFSSTTHSLNVDGLIAISINNTGTLEIAMPVSGPANSTFIIGNATSLVLNSNNSDFLCNINLVIIPDPPPGPATLGVGGTLGPVAGTEPITIDSSETILDLQDQSTINMKVNLLTYTPTISVPTGTGTIAGVISGTGTFNKTGDGTLVLGGINTYTGLTTVNVGTLAVNGSIPGALTVNSGGTLTGVGSISGAVTVNSGGTINGVPVIGGAVTVNGGTINGPGFITQPLTVNAGGTVNAVTTINASVVVNEGTINGPGIIGGALTINSGGTVDGITSINSIVEINAGGTLKLITSIPASVNVYTGGTMSEIGSISGIVSVYTGATASNIANISGDVNIFGGTMNGLGTFTGGQFVINNGGLLNGANSITGNVTVTGAEIRAVTSISGPLIVNGGIVTLANPIGTMTVASMQLDPSTITNIEFTQSGSSLIDVVGNATVNGTLNLIHNEGTYPESGNYEILKAGTLLGTFSSLTGGLPKYNFLLTTVGDSIYLSYTTESINTIGLTGNILIFANYLNSLPFVHHDFLALTALSGKALYNALNSASPARNAFPVFVTQQTVFSLSRMLNEYLRGKRFFSSFKHSEELAAALLPYEYEFVADNAYCYPLLGANNGSETKYALWINGFADFANQKSENQNLPFDFTSEGVLLGFDIAVPFNGLAGLAIGYAHSQIDDQGYMGNSDVSYYIASVYSNYLLDSFYLEGAFWGVFHQIDNQRKISYPEVKAVAKSAINGWQIAPHLEAGYIVDVTSFDFEPYLAVDYVVNWEGSGQERGAGDLSMRQKSNTSSMIQSTAGLRFYQAFETSNARVGLKEGLSYINRTPFSTGRVTSAIFGSSDFFTLTSFTQTQNLGAVSALFFAEMGENRDVIFSLGYEGQFGAQYMLNEIALSIYKSF